jgi:hypothetical protein
MWEMLLRLVFVASIEVFKTIDVITQFAMELKDYIHVCSMANLE